MNEWMNGWTNERTNEWTNKQMNGMTSHDMTWHETNWGASNWTEINEGRKEGRKEILTQRDMNELRNDRWKWTWTWQWHKINYIRQDGPDGAWMHGWKDWWTSGSELKTNKQVYMSHLHKRHMSVYWTACGMCVHYWLKHPKTPKAQITFNIHDKLGRFGL